MSPLDLVDRGELVRASPVYGKASSSSRCHGVSGPNAWPLERLPGGVQLDQLRRDLADRLARPGLGLLPVGAAHLVQRRASRRRRSGRAGRAGRSARTAGRRAGRACSAAYSMTRYSRSAPLTVRCTSSTYLPMPCCSCTTKSPARSSSGSMVLRRRLGILRMSRVDAPRPPVMSLPVSTASRAASSTKPWSSAPQVTSELAGRRRLDRVVGRARTPRPASRSTSAARWAGPWPSKTSATRQPSPVQPLEVVDDPAGLAVVERRPAGRPSATASPGVRRRRRRTVGRLQPRLVRRRGSAASARPNGRHRPPRLAAARRRARARRPGS